jgi:hypothetical protein
VNPITTCANGDSCCLASCTSANDNDCQPAQSACDTCETTTEGELGDLCRSQLDLCDNLPGVTATTIRGVPAGTPRNKLCRDVLNCMHDKHCAGNGSGDCLCGVGADPNSCYAATANMTGLCADLIIAGVESEAIADITQRLPDINYAAAQAFQVVDLCDALSCRDQCL